jgi:GMP synthase (glutamine-hydrolysing)
MKILIIDNTIDPSSRGSKDLRRLAHVAQGSTVVTRRAPDRDLPKTARGFDRIILSGSKTSALEDAPWISELHELVRDALNEKIPFLGVCYGHQTLVRVLGEKNLCRRAEVAEVGWTEIELIGESPLLRGLPKKFFSFSSHFEEVGNLPPGMKNLARSEDCSIQACQLESRPVYGIQFHPEKDVEEADKIFAEKKKLNHPKNLLHPGKSKTLYNPLIGEQIFKNFLETQS